MLTFIMTTVNLLLKTWTVYESFKSNDDLLN